MSNPFTIKILEMYLILVLTFKVSKYLAYCQKKYGLINPLYFLYKINKLIFCTFFPSEKEKSFDDLEFYI